MYTLNVNGIQHQADVTDGNMPLLWVLRDELGLRGTKFGCGMSLCGACTVHLEGEAVRSCQTPIGSVEGKRVVTIEGLTANGPHPVQRAWIAENVPQCGYCQSGQIMSATAFLKSLPRGKQPTVTEIDAAMAGNVCRCGTYARIRVAVADAARALA